MRLSRRSLAYQSAFQGGGSVASGFGASQANGILGPSLGTLNGKPYYQCTGGWWFYAEDSITYAVSSADPTGTPSVKYSNTEGSAVVTGTYHTRGAGTDPGGIVT